MTIHDSHPFADAVRDDGRRIRGRLGARVSLWTSGELSAPPHSATAAAGLTVTSMMVAGGDPWQLLALLDPEADLTVRLLDTGAASVHLLNADHRHVAEVFAGLAPSPGGVFRCGDFSASPLGPRLAGVSTWLGVEVDSHEQVGWSTLVRCRLVAAELVDDVEPLHHVRGRLTTCSAEA